MSLAVEESELLTKAYENGEWEQQQQLTLQLFGKARDLSMTYLDAVSWAHGLMQEAAGG